MKRIVTITKREWPCICGSDVMHIQNNEIDHQYQANYHTTRFRAICCNDGCRVKTRFYPAQEQAEIAMNSKHWVRRAVEGLQHIVRYAL